MFRPELSPVSNVVSPNHNIALRLSSFVFRLSSLGMNPFSALFFFSFSLAFFHAQFDWRMQSDVEKYAQTHEDVDGRTHSLT